MPITQLVLPPVPDGENPDIERDAPRFFTNIDSEPFEFTWDGKPFGGIFPDRMRYEKRPFPERIINDKGFVEDRLADKIYYEFTKPIMPGETVTMPKYLVNYAAMHLARKIYKREAFASYHAGEKEKQMSAIRFVNPAEEYKLMKKIVAKNFPEEDIEEPTMPTHETVIDKSRVDQEEIYKAKKENPVQQGFKCEHCEFTAKTEFGLKSHMRRHK